MNAVEVNRSEVVTLMFPDRPLAVDETAEVSEAFRAAYLNGLRIDSVSMTTSGKIKVVFCL
jgi:hypothetical protein